MSRTVGLTAAMRRALEEVDTMSLAMRKKLYALGLIRFGTFCGISVVEVTPRGHAALAAEPMTNEEYTVMALIAEHKHAVFVTRRTRAALERKGWLEGSELTPAGRTQLHNIRAAMPGDWEERK